MNEFNNKIIFFNGIKPENFSIGLEPIDEHFTKRYRTIAKKITKWDPFLPNWFGNLGLIKWPKERPGLRFAVIQNSMLLLKKDEWAIKGKTYNFKFCGVPETCFVICTGYPQKIDYILNVIFERFLTCNKNLKRKSNEDSDNQESKRFKFDE